MLNYKTVTTKIHALDEFIKAQQIPANDGLFNGKLGLSFYYYQMYKAFGDAEYYNMAIELLQTVLQNVSSNESTLTSNYSLSNGLAGFGYLIEYFVQERIVPVYLKRYSKNIQKTVLNRSIEDLKKQNTDFLHGPLGALYYLLYSGNKNYSTTIVKELKKIKQNIKSGIYFNNNLPLPKNIQKHEGINISLAHGQVGILLVLAECYKEDICRDLLEEMINPMINFIVSLYNNRQSVYSSQFPSLVNGEKSNYNVRLGWCYGDLNEALALIRIGKQFQDFGLLSTGEKFGYATCKRKTAHNTQIQDSHLCHGSAGLAQYYKILFDETNNTEFLNSYFYWLKVTIKNIDAEISSHCFKGKEMSLLEGVAGINLCLLSYLNKNPAWSKMFLL